MSSATSDPVNVDPPLILRIVKHYRHRLESVKDVKENKPIMSTVMKNILSKTEPMKQIKEILALKGAIKSSDQWRYRDLLDKAVSQYRDDLKTVIEKVSDVLPKYENDPTSGVKFKSLKDELAGVERLIEQVAKW